MMTFRATCIIHCSVGWLAISAISTFRLQIDEEEHIVGHQFPQREDLHREISHPSCSLHILTMGVPAQNSGNGTRHSDELMAAKILSLRTGDRSLAARAIGQKVTLSPSKCVSNKQHVTAEPCFRTLHYSP